MLIAWPLAERGQLGWSARLLGAGLGFINTAGATKYWMDHACEAAVMDLLRSGLEANSITALFEASQDRALEEVVRDALTDIWQTDDGGHGISP